MFVISILALFTTLFDLGSKSYWFDEAFSINLSSNWHYMLHNLWTSEANMWLYYVILHFWLYLGNSEFTTRSLSVIFALLSILVTFFIGKDLFNKKIGTLASLLMSINVLFVFYAQMARSYSLLLLLSSISTLVFFWLLKTRKKQYALLYILFTTLGLYTHLYMGFVLLSHGIIVLIRLKKTWKVIPLFFLPLFFSLLMLIAPSSQSNQVSWIAPPTIIDFIVTALVITGDFPPLLIVYAFIYTKLFSIKRTYEEILLWILLIMPPIAGVIISLTLRPIYVAEYFISCLVPFVLLAALYLDQFKKQKIKMILVCLILILSAIRLYGYYSGNIQLQTIVENRNEEWRQVSEHITQRYMFGDAVIFYSYFGALTFQKYSQNTIPKVEIASHIYTTSDAVPPDPDIDKIHSLSAKYARVWFVINHSEYKKETQMQRTQIQNELKKNYNLLKTDAFYKITVEEYVRKTFVE